MACERVGTLFYICTIISRYHTRALPVSYTSRRKLLTFVEQLCLPIAELHDSFAVMTSQRGLLAYITSFWTLDLFHCSPWTARLLCAPFQIFPPLATLLTVLHLTHYIKLPSLVFAYLAFETIFYA